MFPFTLAIGAALGLGFASAASHYVTLHGDDANPGLEGSPWRTLAKACEAVPADAGHTIHIGEGEGTAARCNTIAGKTSRSTTTTSPALWKTEPRPKPTARDERRSRQGVIFSS